jgi:hypothetical protein
MRNFIKIFVIGLLLSSCGEFEPVIFDPNTGQTLAYFGRSTTALEVLINESNSATIPIGVNTLSSTDRTVSISVSASSTASPDMYVVPTSVTIPANQYSGSITVTGIDNGLTTAPVTLILKLDSVSDGGVTSSATHTVTLVEICPVVSTFAVGDYTLNHVSGGIAAAGFAPALGDNVTVELEVGTSATQRIFNVKCYPSFGFANPPADFAFNLVCAEVIASGIVPGQASGVGCGGSIKFGASATSGTYDVDNDSFITLIFAEDTDNICGDTGTTTVTLTKI